MSYPILTLPPGLTFKYTKTPKFNNIVQRPQSGRHPAAATLQQGTIFEFDLRISDRLLFRAAQFLRVFQAA